MTANNKSIFFRGRLILCDRVERGVLEVRDGCIAAKHAFDWPLSPDSVVIDSLDGWISPGFVDLHVHGGDGGDFMDGTPEAFRAALSAHLRHGTTRLAVTTTVARHEQIIRALELTRQFRRLPHPTGSRVLGALLQAILSIRGSRSAPRCRNSTCCSKRIYGIPFFFR